MTRLFGAMLAMAVVVGVLEAPSVRAQDAKAVVDKAIKALGGEAKLSKVGGVAWKAKGSLSFGGNDNPFTMEAKIDDLTHAKQEFEAEFGGMQVKGITQLDGDKGSRGFNDMNMDMDDEAIANEKRTIYLQLVPITMVLLKSKDFTVEAAPEEKINDKKAVGLKITGPDKKDFTMYFDAESGLPVRQVAKVVGFTGEEFTQETNFGDYKDFDGIKKATKVESKRDGEKFLDQELTEFKATAK